MVERESTDNADQGWDNYKERVLRNEGRLEGLENLVRETREADRKLVEQRSDSIAMAVEQAAERLQTLMTEQRTADQTATKQSISALKELMSTLRVEDKEVSAHETELLRTMYDNMIAKVNDVAHSEMAALDDRSKARWVSMEQQVSVWRETDREARELQAAEYARRLDVLNHAHEQVAAFQARSVTRELWDAQEKTTSDKIGTIERALLVMPTNTTITGITDGINKRLEDQTKAMTEKMEAKFEGVNEKIADLKESQTQSKGNQQGRAQLYGWVAAGVGLIATILGIVIVLANVLTSK